MKLCIDCEWHLKHPGSIIDICMHPHYVKPPVVSPVDGSTKYPPTEMCEVARAEHGKCGPDAKLFEEKEA